MVREKAWEIRWRRGLWERDNQEWRVWEYGERRCSEVCVDTVKVHLGVLKICGVELVAAGYTYHVLINNILCFIRLANMVKDPIIEEKAQVD